MRIRFAEVTAAIVLSFPGGGLPPVSYVRECVGLSFCGIQRLARKWPSYQFRFIEIKGVVEFKTNTGKRKKRLNVK